VPQLIIDGTKILSMCVENLHFLDSHNYLILSIKGMTKSFALTWNKGITCKFLTRPTILIYVGPFPELKYNGAIRR